MGCRPTEFNADDEASSCGGQCPPGFDCVTADETCHCKMECSSIDEVCRIGANAFNKPCCTGTCSYTGEGGGSIYRCQLNSLSSTAVLSSMSEPASWSSGTLPGPGDSVVVDNSTLAMGQTVLVTEDMTLGDLTLFGSSGPLTLFVEQQATLTVTGSITLGVGAAIAGNGIVIGNVINDGGTIAPGKGLVTHMVGQLDAVVIDAMQAAVVRSDDPAFNLNGDAAVDELDVDHLIEVELATFYGDVDLDGDVDLSDYNTLIHNFDPLGLNPSHGWATADFDGNGKVDIYDFSLLQQNFGTTSM